MTARAAIQKQIDRALGREDWRRLATIARSALREDPGDHWLLDRLGLALYEQRRYRQAQRVLLRARANAPRCPLVAWDLAGALDAVGETAGAKRLYRQLLRRGPDRMARGECGEGIRWTRGLVADVHFRLGLIAERQGDSRAAHRHFSAYLSTARYGDVSAYKRSEIRRAIARAAAPGNERATG